ncbi:hypothetical protein [Brevibacillus laterosporus]|uniref:hypothetical protein n=1 Tax=Brevibacillus laterosporus TaxID=1465 RepID=UPI0018F88D6A|nr:hypothetical protein [Brevibacillus laterosporus]MBG9774271.1 hypothetical protein [Brevibacillus laterosporus]
MCEVERLAWKIIWRGVKCAAVLAVIIWCASGDPPKKIEVYGPKHVQTKQANSDESDVDDFSDYMYNQWLPQTTTVILF